MDYHKRRHWFHLSQRLRKRGSFVLKPWGSERAYNRSDEPDGRRISVAPTVAQCLTALPFALGKWYVYQTKYKVTAQEPIEVFDWEVTDEGWRIRPTVFVRLGVIDFDRIEADFGETIWPTDAATAGDFLHSESALQDWQRLIPTLDKYMIR